MQKQVIGYLPKSWRCRDRLINYANITPAVFSNTRLIHVFNFFGPHEKKFYIFLLQICRMNFIKNVYIRIFLWNRWTNWRAHPWDADTPWPALISTQWSPFSIPVKRIPRCIFGANLAILIQIHYKLPRKQAKFPRILRQNGQNYLKGQGHWPCIVMPAESIPGCMFVANLLIPAHICEELPCGQAKFPRILSQNS